VNVFEGEIVDFFEADVGDVFTEGDSVDLVEEELSATHG
jgi:hypothetical protein